MVLVIVISASFDLHAQPNETSCSALTGSQRDSLARTYAPVFRFAPQERYLPTVPFFHAFDGLDQGRSGLTDLEDNSEIVPGLVIYRNTPVLSWNLIEQQYRRGTISAEGWYAGPTAVFHNTEVIASETRDEWKSGRSITTSQDIWRYLQSDEQAWRRSGIDTIAARMDSAEQGFVAIEYYLYYVNDYGLEGHQYDIEFVYVFLPCPLIDAIGADDFRIIVGAGHTDGVPNNVFVHLGTLRPDRTNDVRPHVMVELGDHSNATDLYPYGRFRTGWDINWHIQDVWGVRDAQATHGLDYLGDYDIGMTFPREDLATTTLYYRNHPRPVQAGDAAKAYSLISVEDFKNMFDLLAMLPDPRLMVRPSQRSSWSTPPDSLLRVSDQTFDAYLPPRDPICEARYTSQMDKEFLVAFKRLSAATHTPLEHGWTFHTFGQQTLARRRELVCVMRWWLSDLAAYIPKFKDAQQKGYRVKEVPNTSVTIWTNDHYTRPTHLVFKTHLFRPVEYQSRSFAGDILTFPKPQFTWIADNRFRLHFGSVIPLQANLPIQPPGVMELQAGVYGDLQSGLSGHRLLFSFAVVWERHYARPLSWFIEMGGIVRRRSLDPDRSHFTISTGPSLLVAPVFKTRIRFGPRLDVRGSTQSAGVIDWAFHFSTIQ